MSTSSAHEVGIMFFVFPFVFSLFSDWFSCGLLFPNFPVSGFQRVSSPGPFLCLFSVSVFTTKGF